MGKRELPPVILDHRPAPYTKTTRDRPPAHTQDAHYSRQDAAVKIKDAPTSLYNDIQRRRPPTRSVAPPKAGRITRCPAKLGEELGI